MTIVKAGQATSALRDLVGRIPQWLRNDLNATDSMLRERAEDALVAMIAALVGDRRFQVDLDLAEPC